mmetsp:Transcript_49401/g.158056  ORF Transcript_49401/g.158056 Transcript_49401/m.158056 type:complete len:238 (-) Transcript_49401:129-842(-)
MGAALDALPETGCSTKLGCSTGCSTTGCSIGCSCDADGATGCGCSNKADVGLTACSALFDHPETETKKLKALKFRLETWCSRERRVVKVVRFWKSIEKIAVAGYRIDVKGVVGMTGGRRAAISHSGIIMRIEDPKGAAKPMKPVWLKLEFVLEGLLSDLYASEPKVSNEMDREQQDIDVPLRRVLEMLRQCEGKQYSFYAWNCHRFSEFVWTEMMRPEALPVSGSGADALPTPAPAA